MDIIEKWDGSEKDKQRLIDKYPAMRLKEEQRHKDGNWLIFTDEPEPEPPPDYKALYAQAPNDAKRLEVIAKKLELV